MCPLQVFRPAQFLQQYDTFMSMAEALSYGSFDALFKKMASTTGGVTISTTNNDNGAITTYTHFRASDVVYSKRGEGLEPDEMKVQRLELFTTFMTNIKTYCEAL